MNFSYTTNPGYMDLFVGFYKSVTWYYRADNWGDYSFPMSFFKEFRHYYFFKLEEALPMIYIAILFTIMRYAFERLFCKVGFLAFLAIRRKLFLKKEFFSL